MSYVLGKRAISQFVRSDCRRRLRLDLYGSAAAREAAAAPEKDNFRPGLALFTQAGKSHERRKFAELVEVLPQLVTHGAITEPQDDEERAYAPINLADHIATARPNRLFFEAEYEVTDPFVDTHDLRSLKDGSFFGGVHALGFSRVRPDIIQVLASNGTARRAVLPDGRIAEVADQGRLGLKIIDIKISGEASPSHFAELSYYAMTLAAWLIHYGYDDRFFVLADAAVWPGRHDDSSIEKQIQIDLENRITVRDQAVYLDAFGRDLEHMPPEVVLGRVARFLRHELRAVLEPANWLSLAWHVDRRCSGCDYLGYAWSTREDQEAGIPTPGRRTDEQNDRYCWPMAARCDHPSRIMGLTEGAAGKLSERGLESVEDISGVLPGNIAFEDHQTLRAKRTVLVARGQSLNQQTPADIPNRAGTSAVLPRFADIEVFLSVDFDVATGLTFAFGSYVSYGVPDGRNPETGGYRRRHRDHRRPFLVLGRSIEEEAEAFSEWLGYVMQDIHRARRDILAGYHATNPDKDDVSIQFYVWDKLIYEHFRRLSGRHLELVLNTVVLDAQTRDRIEVAPLSWLFPAERVMNDVRFTTVSSPLTVVSEIVNGLMAAPVPHHYGLVEFANELDRDRRRREDGSLWGFDVHKFYFDPLSDQIPSERGTEIWERRSPFRTQDYQWHQERMRRVVIDKLRAVEWVVAGLRRRLGEALSAKAPSFLEVLSPGRPLTGVGLDGQMIYQHARLMKAAEKLESQLLMAMPPHERESRFESARVERTLEGREREAGLAELELAGLTPNRMVFLFDLREDSKEVRAKNGDYLLSFAPEDFLAVIQHDTVADLKREYPALAALRPIEGYDHRSSAREALRAKLIKLDRGRRRIVLEFEDLLADLVILGIVDLNFTPAGRFGILDRVVIDYFTPRLRDALSGRDKSVGIRNPPLSSARPLFAASIANVAALRARATGSVPAETFIWNADVAARSMTGADSAPMLAHALRWNPSLTQRQVEAVERSIQRRLAIWWGPPGTGKSATAQAMLAGLIGAAAEQGSGLRIAITAFTWVAIDHVARKVPEILQTFGLQDRVRLVRLASTSEAEVTAPELDQYLLPMTWPETAERIQLEEALTNRNSIVIVASTAAQLAKLGSGSVLAPLFDVMLIDEASQVDVAQAIVSFTKLAPDARLTVIGDDLQMAPIHPIEPPDGAEHLVGSIFDFYRNYRGELLERTMLDRSFRSNREIIEFVREAGYPDLEAAERNADIRYATAAALPAAKPDNWPEDLAWTNAFAPILDPQRPLAAVVHDDRYSSQRNQEEADLVAGLVLTLFEQELMDIDGGNAEVLSPTDFFRKGIGIVTPHRAQQAAVFERISSALAGRVDENEIFAAIDTVERFQGQEKTVMIASFGLGDKDQIAAEETFLFNLNRFNVTASRAKAKFVAIMSRRLVDHLPSDKEALIQSRLIKHFVDGFLRRTETISVAGFQNTQLHTQ